MRIEGNDKSNKGCRFAGFEFKHRECVWVYGITNRLCLDFEDLSVYMRDGWVASGEWREIGSILSQYRRHSETVDRTL